MIGYHQWLKERGIYLCMGLFHDVAERTRFIHLFAQSLGLIIPRGQCVSGHEVRAKVCTEMH